MRAMSEWWISFAGEGHSLGVVIVQAKSAAAALVQTVRLGCNPGGEAMIFELPPGEEVELPRNVLISPQDLQRAGHRKVRDLTLEQKECLKKHPVSNVCQECNEP